MVNNPTNVSFYRKANPPNDGEDRVIQEGPLYQAPVILKLISSKRNSVRLWTESSINDALNLGLDVEDLAGLIAKSLTNSSAIAKYKKSEWCQQSWNGPWAACDVYLVSNINIPGLNVSQMYLKFALAKTGQLILSVSNHPPRPKAK